MIALEEVERMYMQRWAAGLDTVRVVGGDHDGDTIAIGLLAKEIPSVIIESLSASFECDRAQRLASLDEVFRTLANLESLGRDLRNYSEAIKARDFLTCELVMSAWTAVFKAAGKSHYFEEGLRLPEHFYVERDVEERERRLHDLRGAKGRARVM